MAGHADILIADNEQDFATLAAQKFVNVLEGLDHPLVTLPTGLTPLSFYKTLISDHANRRDLWDQMRFIALDEYAGLPAGDERLFAQWLGQALLNPLDIQTRALFDSAADPVTEATRMQKFMEQDGPLDVAVLGLGGNGHVAFNEPGTSFDQKAHVVTLTPETVNANAAYWGGVDRVPRQGITLGLADLAQARQTILLVKGTGKATILKRALQGPVTTDVPASYLQTIKNVTIIADRDAAQDL
jgi:glucosamine-6-phosphate deaminase